MTESRTQLPARKDGERKRAPPPARCHRSPCASSLNERRARAHVARRSATLYGENNNIPTIKFTFSDV